MDGSRDHRLDHITENFFRHIIRHIPRRTQREPGGSVEIPDLASLPEIHDEPVFDGYRKGGCSLLGRDGGHEKIPKVSSLCRSGGRQFEDFLKDIFSSLPFPAGTANISKNVIKNDDFYGAYRGEFLW
jgi:hypothetical protein